MTTNDEDTDIYNVEKIVDFRQRGSKRQFLVKWEGYPDSQNTWEDEKNIFAKDLIKQYFDEKKSAYSKKTKNATETTKTVEKTKKPKVVESKKSEEKTDEKLSEEKTDNFSFKKDTVSKKEKKLTTEINSLATEYNSYLKNDSIQSMVVSNDFDFVIENVQEVWSCEDKLYARVLLANKELGVFECAFLHYRAPVKLLKYYESMIVFSADNDPQE